MSSVPLLGILSFAWKIFRGAEVASTEMFTVGPDADHPGTIKTNRTQTTPKSLESLILFGPHMDYSERIRDRRTLNYSSGREPQYREAPALLSFERVATGQIHHLRRA